MANENIQKLLPQGNLILLTTPFLLWQKNLEVD